MAPKMKAKRSASGDSVPTGDMPQAVRDLDHKLHDLVAAYDDGKKEILAKMGDSKNLNNKMDNTHKAVADSLEELTKLRDLMKENQETIDKLKSDSALANEKMKELVSKVTLMEEQLNMKKNDGSSSICTGDLASKLTTVQQNTGEILSKENACILKTQECSNHVEEKMQKHFTKIGKWLVNNVNRPSQPE